MKDLEANYYHYLLAIHNLLRPKYFNKDNIVGSDLYNRETIIDSEIVNRMLDIVLPLYQEHNIKVVRCEKDDRFIIMGDFHGSLHSFIRILFRLHLYNVLDIKTLILQPNYKMVFLGDIVDRGMFSTEILFTILLLIKNNKERVIFIAGNHEASTQPINSRDGFETELLFTYNNDNTLYRRFNQLFGMLPVAVLLHEPTNNQTVWLSHGCFNSSLDYNLSNYVYKNTSTITIRGNNLIDSILWSDIHYLDGERAGGDSYKQNKRHEFRKFMKDNQITGVIRGHQDNFSNSIIYYHENNGTNYMKINELENSGTCDEKQVCYNKISNSKNRTNGAIGRIVVSTDNYQETSRYQPVITISTATDIKKSLYADSFGLLRFDLIDNIGDFTTSLQNKNKLP
jgi:hypothetical protein